eukprot:4231127-Prymnesium_polylepis.1
MAARARGVWAGPLSTDTRHLDHSPQRQHWMATTSTPSPTTATAMVSMPAPEAALTPCAAPSPCPSASHAASASPTAVPPCAQMQSPCTS